MTPGSLVFQFLANNVSYKFDEIKANSNVNLSFIDTSTTNWASIAGQATVSRDQATIDKLWSPFVAGYFTDLKDGVHKGDKTDPRVSVISVIPHEIRYWVSTSTVVGRAVEHAKGAVTGKLTAPGEIRTITSEEVITTVRSLTCMLTHLVAPARLWSEQEIVLSHRTVFLREVKTRSLLVGACI
jgi:general stress protein 26